MKIAKPSFFVSVLALLSFSITSCTGQPSNSAPNVVATSASDESADGCRIEIQLANFSEQEVQVAQYFGDKPYLMDTLQRQADGNFLFIEPAGLDPGMYFLILPPDRKFIQFLIAADDQHFTIRADAENLQESSEVIGSAENDLFNDYLEFTKVQQEKMNALREQYDQLTDPESAEALSIEDQLQAVQDEIRAYNERIAAEHSNTVTGTLLKAEIDVEIPEFEGDEETVKFKKFYYRRAHYFDNAPLDDNRLLRSPVLFKKVNFYIDKMTAQNADSLTQGLFTILDGTLPTEENLQFFLIHYLNKYGESNVLGLDEVFVNLVDRYVSSGKATFMDEETRKKVIEKAEKMKPTLIGKKAPEITVFDESGNPISLYDVDADYTVLIFWRPECTTCQKSMPDVIRFYDQYKDKGVKVMSVCTDMGEKASKCWPYTKQKGMEGRFINANDPGNKSRFYQKYDVRTTPKILILDKNKEILVNRIGASQLGEMMSRYIN